MKRTISLLFIFITGVFTCRPSAAQYRYPYRFNPEAGFVHAAERPYREEICLNGNWKFTPVVSRDTGELARLPVFRWSKVPIRIPSPWNVNSFARGNGDNFVTFPSYPRKWEQAPVGWMEKEFTVPESWKGKELFLHFEAVAGKAVYYLNGKKIGEHFDIFFPYEVDITAFVKPGSTNNLVVGVASPKLYDSSGRYGRRRYIAGSFWGTSVRGIWQDVYLLAKPKVYISNLYIRPRVKLHSLQVEVTVQNCGDRTARLQLSGQVRPWRNLAGKGINQAPVQKGVLGSPVLSLQDSVMRTLAPGESLQLTLTREVEDQLAYWTPETPRLYGLVLSLKAGRNILDRKYTRFGWRQFTLEQNKLLLNGKVIHLKGDSWHFMGVLEMTRRYAWAWFKTLKDAHANAVRLHAEPYPRFFLDVADEMGICVLDESGIWASDGGPKTDSPLFWKNCKTDIKELVLRDRNHPAVFGWSVSNEIIPVAVNVFHAPSGIVDHLLGQINSWVTLVRKLDPSRPWISGDGETQFSRKLNLPTVVGHYGGKGGMQHWSEEGKPWGIGEQGMAYYGTPAQVSVFNGNRAYVSQQGRMEGLAIQAYQLITTQRKLGASYSCIFNIVWYGLKPLPFGMKSLSEPATDSDGIFFTHFKEGEPGMQPERLGPYTSTLNPGYDPSLPLYAPWPLFYAVRAANATPPEPFTISPDSVAVPVILKGFSPVRKKVLLFSGARSPLFARLKDLGLGVSGQSGDPSKTLILIDGKHPPTGRAIIHEIRRMTAEGSTTFILGVSSPSMQSLNRILPLPLQLTGRRATSFIKKENIPVLSGLGNSDFYFTERVRKPVMIHGLSGPLVHKGSTFLTACNTDWSRWNSKPEYMKTASVLGSERQKKEPGNALVCYHFAKGKYLVSALEPDSLRRRQDALMEQMLSNLGAVFTSPSATKPAVPDPAGFIDAALLAGAWQAAGMDLAQMAAYNFTGQDLQIRPYPGEVSRGKYWQLQHADSTHIFDIARLPLTGPRDHAVAYLSFWIYSPRSLVNLLAEPDMPSLDLVLQAGDGACVLLNGRWIGDSPEKGPATLKNIPLHKGWNHFLIKLLQNDRDWKFSARFTSDQPDFIRQLHDAATNYVSRADD